MANTASVLPSAFREGFAVNIAPVHSSRNDTASISGTVSGVASLNIVALESVTVSPIVRLSADSPTELRPPYILWEQRGKREPWPR